MRSLLYAMAVSLSLVWTAGAQEVLHYWHFNDTDILVQGQWPTTIDADIGEGLLSHTFTDAQSFTGTALNAEPGIPAGGSFSPRGGTDAVNNGRSITLAVSTEGYDEIALAYASRGTSTGFDTHEIYYTTDGETFLHHSTIIGRRSTSFSVIEVDFSDIAEVRNNPDFAIRIVVDGATSDMGNNRFDNIKVTSGFADPDPATHLVFVDVPAGQTANQFLDPFSVEALRDDESVDEDFTAEITISKGQGPGAISGTLTRTAVAGVATFSDISFDQPGTYTIVASAGGLPQIESPEIVIDPEDPSIASILAYWHFNTEAPLEGPRWPAPVDADFGDGSLTYNFDPDYVVGFSGIDLNARFGEPAGSSFSVQMGPGGYNHGRHFDLAVPTTGFGSISLSYATRGTATGFNLHEISYSMDGGQTFAPYRTIDGRKSASWSVFEIDFWPIQEAGNNPDFVIRITGQNEGETSDLGNNRFDNIVVSGFPLSGNQPPYFTHAPTDQSIDADAEFSFQYEAEDPDGDPLAFDLVDAPQGAEISSTGLFTWTPTVEQGDRSWTITATVTDGIMTTSTSAELFVVAFPENTPPLFTSALPDTVVRVDQTLTFTYAYVDPDGDELSVQVVRSPDGAAFDEETGLFTFTPSEPGAYRFTLSVTDGMAATISDAVIGVRGTLFTELDGADLREAVRESFFPDSVMSYSVARDSMYSVLDLEADGFVRGVYSGFGVKLEGPGTTLEIMSQGGINTEHTWPQSMGASSPPGMSDLHHLFPTRSRVNSARANYPFANIPAGHVEVWYRNTDESTETPSDDLGTYSRLAGTRFEPRDVHKGPAARATLYFFAIHQNVASLSFLLNQADVLVEWNASFSPTGREFRRSYLISKWQGNLNPFLVDSTLAERIMTDLLDAEELTMAEARALEDNAVVTVQGIVTRARGRYLRFQDETAGLTIFSSGGPFHAAIADGSIAMSDRLRVSGTMATFSAMRQLDQTSFEVISRGNALPEPADVTLDEIAGNGEAYESRLVRVEGFTIDAPPGSTFTASTTYSLLDDEGQTSPVALRVQRDTDSAIVGEAIPEGPARFIGVLGRFEDAFQIEAVEQDDIEPAETVSTDAEIPLVFSISNVYPNPFRSEATLNIQLVESEHVRIEMFDVLGRRLAVLQDDAMPAGLTQSRISASTLPSGTYFLRIRTSDRTEQRMFVVTR